MDILRLATGDADCLRAIRLRALRDAPEAFGTTFAEAAAWPMESWTRQLAELATFIAVIDGADVGLARGGPHDGKPGAAILLSMWVAPEARGKGVGDALIDSVIAWARGEGFSRLLLEVGDHNEPAIALYARKGFRPTGATSTLPPPRTHVPEHERALELLNLDRDAARRRTP